MKKGFKVEKEDLGIRMQNDRDAIVGIPMCSKCFKEIRPFTFGKSKCCNAEIICIHSESEHFERLKNEKNI